MTTIELRERRDSPVYEWQIAEEQSSERAKAWLKVVGCFFVFFNSYGLASSFGVYQAYYETDLLTSHSASAISWIGTTQLFLLGILGVLSGPLCDRNYGQVLLSVGCLLVVFGLFMLSIATEYWQVMLAQGFCIGLGNGLTYVPAVSIVATTFTNRRAIALGIAASGSAFGSTLIPIMFQRIVEKVGFGWVNRILAFIILIVSALAIFFLRTDSHRPPQTHHTFFDASAFKEPAYLMLCFGLFFVELGYWIPPFSLPPYAQFSLHTSAQFGSYLLAIMNAGGLAGRIIPAFLAHVYGAHWVLVAGCAGLGVLVLSWLGVHNVPGIVVWGVLVGFMAGIAVSMPNAVVPRLSPARSVVGARTGMMWCFTAFAALVGSPVAGLLIDPATGEYRNGEIFSGVSICVGSALLIVPALRVMKDDRKDL